MLEIIDQLRTWDEPFALATVTDIWQSAPRGPGAAMALHPSGAVAGSVSLGCIEGDVYLRCEDVLATGASQAVRYGVTDEQGLEIGMTCGGEVEMFVQRIDPSTVDLAGIAGARAAGHHAGVVTFLDGSCAGGIELVPEPPVSITAADARPGPTPSARDAWQWARRSGANQTVTTENGERLFVQLIAPPARLLLFGGADFAAAIAEVARLLDYRITVCDARPAFATPERFPAAHEVIVAWPHRYLAQTPVEPSTAICVLTHDAKFDEPLLEVACRTSAGYIGVMGSRRTHQDRLSRLRGRGIDEADLARLSSPVGLDLGGYTPQETALSVMAEITAHRRGGSGQPLAQRGGPIHVTRSVHA